MSAVAPQSHAAPDAVGAVLARVAPVTVALVGVAGFVGLLAALTWGTWGDLDSDTGYETLRAARVADGELPYRDFIYFYGPLAPALVGLASFLGGGGIGSTLAVGVVVTAAILTATYLLGAHPRGPHRRGPRDRDHGRSRVHAGQLHVSASTHERGHARHRVRARDPALALELCARAGMSDGSCSPASGSASSR